jgi:hypothetical protein
MNTILISYPEAGQNSDLIHNFRNLGEAIYREFQMSGKADVPDMDDAVSELHVVVPSARDLGVVGAYVKKAISRYGLSEKVRVSRV